MPDIRLIVRTDDYIVHAVSFMSLEHWIAKNLDNTHTTAAVLCGNRLMKLLRASITEYDEKKCDDNNWMLGSY